MRINFDLTMINWLKFIIYTLINQLIRQLNLTFMIYTCQEKVWMDKAMMNVWIDLVLIPWRNMGSRSSATACSWCLPCSYNGSIVNHIQALGIEVQHISAGCTYLCRPMEVGIDHSIKKEMTEQWEEWMINGGGVEDGVEKPQQEGRWQSGSSGDINLLPNRQPKHMEKMG